MPFSFNEWHMPNAYCFISIFSTEESYRYNRDDYVQVLLRKRKFIPFFYQELCMGTFDSQSLSIIASHDFFDFTVIFVRRTNMEDLIEATHRKHYELYRKQKLEEKGFDDGQDR